MRRPIPWRTLVLFSTFVTLLSACGTVTPGRIGSGPSSTIAPSAKSSTTTTVQATTTTTDPYGPGSGMLGPPLAAPATLVPFNLPSFAGAGIWKPEGRSFNGVPTIYETSLVPPGGNQPAGIAWMDTNLLSARLYSGSRSPGGGPYRYTPPIQPAQAASLVAAFNGGFIMNVAGGGYYSEGRMVYPLVQGAASLVIYSNGSVGIGSWGSDVTMTPNVVSVRQNLVLLVSNGQPTAAAASPNWLIWGGTCGATSCVGPGLKHQWRSGVGITSDGALIYVTGPSLDPLQLSQLLVRAGAVRGMELDINPYWTVFVTYDPPTPSGVAAPSNGSKLVATTIQGPATFFQTWWARDFITMSLRSPSSN